MRKTTALVLLIAWTGAVVLAKEKGKQFEVNFNLTANFSFDDRYQGFNDIYGPFHLGADATAKWNFFDRFNLWTGIGFVPAFATIPDFNDRAFSWQLYLQLGLGYRFRLLKQTQLNLHAGAVQLLYGERAMGTSASDGTLGFEGGLDLQFPLHETLFFSILCDYIFSSTTYNKKDMLPGGLRIGLGLGRRL